MTHYAWPMTHRFNNHEIRKTVSNSLLNTQCQASSCNTENRKKCVISTVQCSSLFLYPSFQHYRQSLHSFGKEHVTLWGNYVACIKCTKMSFALCRRRWNNQQSSCAIRQWRIWLFMLPPSMKWIETISYNVRRQKLSLTFSNFVQYTVIQWFRRC